MSKVEMTTETVEQLWFSGFTSGAGSVLMNLGFTQEEAREMARGLTHATQHTPDGMALIRQMIRCHIDGIDLDPVAIKRPWPRHG